MPNRLFRFFFPEEVDFFTPMARIIDCMAEGAEAYIETAGKSSLCGPEKIALLDHLKKLEKEGDNILRTVATGLKRTFTPPYPAIDIHRMFESLDNAIDLLDESAKIIIHANYRDYFPPFVAKQLTAFLNGAREAGKLPELMRDPRKNSSAITAVLEAMGRWEAEGDKIYWENKKALSEVINSAAQSNNLAGFRRGRMDEMALDLLEQLVDTLLDIIKNAEDMLIEHA
ncbi:MAG: DUF47 family protein [Nitrospinae bacterium]|nr:DUF47 family protein [Nitrospinota bacterium]